jgi:hypothetical protein
VAAAFPLFTHCTTEHGRILLPVTVKDWVGLPTAAEVCDRAGVPGAASAVVGVKIVNGILLEVPGDELAGSLETVTVAVPGNAVSVEEMTAVRYGAGFGLAIVAGGWT